MPDLAVPSPRRRPRPLVIAAALAVVVCASWWLSPTCEVWLALATTDRAAVEASAFEADGASMRFRRRVDRWGKRHFAALLRTAMRGDGGDRDDLAWNAVSEMLLVNSGRFSPDPQSLRQVCLDAGIARWGIDVLWSRNRAAQKWMPLILGQVLHGDDRIAALRALLAQPAERRRDWLARRIFYELADAYEMESAPADIVMGFAEMTRAEAPTTRKPDEITWIALRWLPLPPPLQDEMIRVYADQAPWPFDMSLPRGSPACPALPDMAHVDSLVRERPALAARLLAGTAERTDRFDAILPGQLRRYAARARTRSVIEAVAAADVRPALRDALRRVLDETPVAPGP